MAGISWIKVETTLPNKPVVLTLRRLLKKTQNEVVGMLVRLLCWADGVTEDGILRGLTVDDLDIIVDSEGFGAALLQAGWLTQGEDLSFREWDRHNGATAKKRALDARRSEKQRDKKRDMSRCERDENHADSVTESGQVRDLDKIRIDKNIARSTRACASDFVTSGEDEEAAQEERPPTEQIRGANALCMAWPKRTFCSEKIRVAYASCLAEGITHEELMECLRLAKLSKQWEEQDGRFIPTLDKWLHERRFEADLKRVRADKKRRDDKRKDERDANEINALIYGDWTDEEDE